LQNEADEKSDWIFTDFLLELDAQVAICELPYDPISSDTRGGYGGT
jgi:hypothetical protein